MFQRLYYEQVQVCTIYSQLVNVSFNRTQMTQGITRAARDKLKCEGPHTEDLGKIRGGYNKRHRRYTYIL